MNERSHNKSTSDELTALDNIQNNNEKQMEEKDTNIAPNSKYSNDKENAIRTRYGRIMKKLKEHYRALTQHIGLTAKMLTV